MRISAGALRCAAALALILACFATGAAAQGPDPNRGRITFTGALDFTNTYMFRGLLQDDTQVILQPFIDAAADVYSGSTGNRVTVHLGTWNSLHTGAAGREGPSRELWYESDVYAGLEVVFEPGLSVGTTFTTYLSPNNSFSTVKEFAFRAGYDDRDAPAGVSLKPYALLAFEFDTLPGLAQADQGLNAGTYLELGVEPGWSDPNFGLAFPVKLGLSLDDYYELAGVDHTFGYLSLGATATLPLGGTTDFGAWNVHGGFEFQSLGDTPEAFNRGDQTKIIWKVGVGFTY
jgi:hypothetical protein